MPQTGLFRRPSRSRMGGTFFNPASTTFRDPRIPINNRIRLEGGAVKGIVEERAVELGEYIVRNKATVRSTAKKFGVSKSTVHKDVAQRLKAIDPQLYKKVKVILEFNKSQRHIRGGIATRLKYKKSL